MLLESALLKASHHKLRIKGEVEKPMEKSTALPYTSL